MADEPRDRNVAGDAGAPGAGARPTAMVRIGPLRLTGAAAALFELAMLALIGVLVWWLHPAWRWGWLWVSGALWIAFIGYWSARAMDRAASKSAESAGSRALHSNLLNLSILLLFLRVPGLKTRWAPETALVIGAGLALHALCFALAVWARVVLGRNWSGEVATKVGHQLVRSGPYARVRHPIYTAMLGMALGTALVSGETHALVGFAIMALIYARKMAMEERQMLETFGDAYDDYRRHSRALIPWVL